jgi:hypothetical protein
MRDPIVSAVANSSVNALRSGSGDHAYLRVFFQESLRLTLENTS